MRAFLTSTAAALMTAACLLTGGGAGAQTATETTGGAVDEAQAAELVERALLGHILPAYDRLQAATGALVQVAPSCDEVAIRSGYNDVFDAWMGATHISMGPIEEEDRRFAMEFWPDKKNHTDKAIDRLIDKRNDVVDDPEAFAKVSVAARGLMALERLLYDDGKARRFAGEDGAYRCRLAVAIAGALDRTAREVRAGWDGKDGYATLLREAGSEDNPLYFSHGDAVRDLFKVLDSGLEALKDLRLGRPLGSYEHPRPRRAEAWRSGRPLRNIVLSLTALRSYYDEVFADTLSEEDRAGINAMFDRAEVIAKRAPKPMIKAVAEPSSRLAIESLQTQLADLQERLRKIVAPAIGASLGFNSLDGD